MGNPASVTGNVRVTGTQGTVQKLFCKKKSLGMVQMICLNSVTFGSILHISRIKKNEAIQHY